MEGPFPRPERRTSGEIKNSGKLRRLRAAPSFGEKWKPLEDQVQWAASRAEAVRCADEIYDLVYPGVRR